MKPNCNHSNNKIIADFESARLYQCLDCQLIFSDQYKTGLNPNVLYNNYYKNEIVGRFNYGLELIIRAFRFFRAFKIKTATPKAKSILDIGSGRGLTLFYLKKYYHYQRTAGTQISNNAYNYSKHYLGLEIYNQDLLELNLENSSFDLITLWHVFEHLPQTEKYLQEIHRLLKPLGRLIIEVPNFNSWTRKLTKKYWLGLDLKYHLSFFTPSILASLFKKYDFQIKLIRTFSLEYSTFISAQSLISWLTKTDQLLFKWLQGESFRWVIIWHLLLFLLISPVCLIINLLFYFSNKGEVLFILAEKK